MGHPIPYEHPFSGPAHTPQLPSLSPHIAPLPSPMGCPVPYEPSFSCPPLAHLSHTHLPQLAHSSHPGTTPSAHPTQLGFNQLAHPLHFSVTYSILSHPPSLDPWPPHTLWPTPSLGSPIGHGKHFPSAHPMPMA
ncbi:hypothetical protein PAXRUDRAFT_793734, partial [Paxillus rubicundulus Ve08.2h10]